VGEGGETQGEGGATDGEGGETQGEGGATDGEGGVTGEGGSTGTPTSALEDLIGALCAWEFGCCDDGEVDYQLGTFVTSEAQCVARFTAELSSNATNNEYAAVNSAAVQLLGSLAYSVNLNWVEVNTAGVEACTAQWLDAGCTPERGEPGHCVPGAVGESPCALTNLFVPIREAGEQCNLQLREGLWGGNDVECVEGTTCVAAGDPDNPLDYPVCVSRGREGDFCTISDTGCDYGFFCNVDGECQEKGDAGEACSYVDPDEPVPGELDASCKPGLTCNPNTLNCEEYCTLGALCSDDLSCPEGLSCIPINVGDDSTSFKACGALGESASARCDTQADCEERRNCTGGRCVVDVELNDPCTRTEPAETDCASGLFCDTVTLTCETELDRGAECVRDATGWSNQCDPGALCIWDPELAVPAPACSVNKLALTEECELDYDCVSGLCEAATVGAAPTCVAGADAGDDCDSDTADGENQRCAPGLSCDPTSNSCVALMVTGGSCENELGDADAAMCGNSACLERWEDQFMCTDLAIPVESGGTGLVCDGA